MHKMLLKLSRMILSLHEVESDKGNLIYMSSLEVGSEVFVEKDEEMLSAEDGEYKIEDKTYTIKDGKIENVLAQEVEEVEVVPEPEEVPAEEAPVEDTPVVEAEPEEVPEAVAAEEEVVPVEEPADEETEVAEVEADNRDEIIADLKNEVESLKAQLAEQDKLLNESQAFSAHEVAKSAPKKENPLLKNYFK